MPNASDIQTIIRLLRLQNPDAVRLGELVSLAARVEPELLRAARLELTPFEAAAEADLWFSPLVETRTADWIAFAPGAALELQSALAADSVRLGAAYAILMEAHRGAPAAIILEEEIVWLALSASPDAQAAIESRLRLVLGKLLEDPSAHRGLAHWFAGAARRLPEVAQKTEAYALLCFVTSGLLDGRNIGAAEAALPGINALAGVWPASIPKLRLWATLTDGGLRIRPNRVPGFVPLEVPRTDPLLLELRQANEPRQLIALRRGETRTIRINSRPVELHTAAGDAYRLRHRPQKRFSASTQGLVLGFGGTGAHILTALKELSLLKDGRVPETLKFLLFDTISDWQPGMAVQIFGGAAEEKLASSYHEAASVDPLTEYFYLRDFDPDLKQHVYDYLSPKGNPDAFPHLKDWLHAPWFSEQIPAHQLSITHGAAQQRQIGRYAMFKNAEKIVAHLRPIIRNLAEQARGADVNVWLIGSSAGGTGAGCLIDAAYLTRLAADENVTLKVTGVIALPNVYMNAPGISQGRAYGLFRELERVQEQGISSYDRYVGLNDHKLISSSVIYDKNGQQEAMVSGRLFDDLFYAGSNCPNDEERRTFFNSVANAIDPYLDAHSGPMLLENAVNNIAAVSAFGAARIYVPTETFAQMFAWEQVAEYLRGAAAPKEVGDHVERLQAGSEEDRAQSATEKFRNLLELFKRSLDLEERTARAKELFARYELTAERIVTLSYELAGSTRTPEEQAVLLAYVNPLHSLTEPGVPKNVEEWETKTYKENAQAKGAKETQEESRDRFADRLEEVTKRYLNPNGGERTFEKGRRQVFEIVSRRLQKKVDDLFIVELNRRPAQFTQADDAPEQGTGLTRLFAEVTWMLSDRGPLRKVHQVIGQFVAGVAKEQAERDNNYTRALQDLRESRKSGFFSFGLWVEVYQQTARDACTDYIRWYQKHELLKDMQRVVLAVEQRLREWERSIGQLFDALVLRDWRSEREASALSEVTQVRLKVMLDRLYRAARNRSALISFGQQPDPQMHGYQEKLRRQSASGLAAELLSQSYWEGGLSADETPNITLVIDSPPLPEQRYATRDIRSLPQQLHQLFYKRIDERLSNMDVFDYLLWLREHRDIRPEEMVMRLNAEAATLINADGVPETRTLVYRAPSGFHKEALADSLTWALEPLDRVERAYSDRNAITLLKIKKPSLEQIRDIEVCRDHYLALQVDHLNNNEPHDSQLRQAQVFHVFPQELEAWYIECSYLKQMQSADVRSRSLPPRIVRLLEDPDMMQIFVHGIATAAVERIESKGWLWHGPDGDVLFIDNEDDPTADVVRAAVFFVLRKGEGRRGGLIPIPREAARQSVLASALAKGQALDELLLEFVKGELDSFLAANAPASLRGALKMVFTFYCDPKRRTGLQFRVNLP